MDIHEAKVKDFELKRKMKVTVVPTDDLKVRQMLRQLGEPITIFGEKEVCGCVRGVCSSCAMHHAACVTARHSIRAVCMAIVCWLGRPLSPAVV